jgi:hypothetical protein
VTRDELQEGHFVCFISQLHTNLAWKRKITIVIRQALAT